MDPSLPLPAMSACPAAPVIVAARLARTPLAIADAQAPGAPILFANDAFGALLGREPATLAGRPLGGLSVHPGGAVVPGGTWRLDVETASGHVFAAALSTAIVPGADGAPMCLLCSLVEARGEGAEAAIERDAELLAQVARAAGDLMQESGIAAAAMSPDEHDAAATRIARRAVEHATQADQRTTSS